MLKLFFVGLLSLFCGCGNNIKFYEKNSPKANAKDFFTGELEAFGTVFDYRDRSATRFKMNGIGQIKDGKLVFEEKIIYHDKTEQDNLRIMSFDDNNKFTFEKVSDMPKGGHGEFSGNAINMKYDLLLGKDGASITLSCNDWIYLIDEKNAINKIIMKKFGIAVAEVIMYIKKK